MSKGMNWSRAKKPKATEPASPNYALPKLYDPSYVKLRSGPVRRLTKAEIRRIYGRKA